jgi:3-hydroxybutyryl-CoA dehydratase
MSYIVHTRSSATSSIGDESGQTWDLAMDAIVRNGRYFEDLEVGMEASYGRIVTDEDIVAFAMVTGDDNPVHLDPEYAAASMFKERIAHGMLTASYLSTIFGTKLPGPGCIYVSQSLSFRAPVKIGDLVEAKVTLTELITQKRRAIFACDCSVAGKTVLQGEAVLMVPTRPDKIYRAL